MGCKWGGGCEHRTEQVQNSAAFMALSARLPLLTALVLPQSQLETPHMERLSSNEPPRREPVINSVYICIGLGGVSVCVNVTPDTIFNHAGVCYKLSWATVRFLE